MILAATPQQSDGKVVFILMDNITWSDIINANDPTINGLIKNGAIGLLNNRAFKASSRPRNALSVGAGIRADGASTSFEEFNATEAYGDEQAKDAYRLRTGKTAKAGQVLEVGIASIVRDNDNGLQDFFAGQLGDAIKTSGKKTAVIGNADTSLQYEPGSYNREAVTIAMDSNGIVDYGDVGKDILKKDKKYPFGLRTDQKKLLTLFGAALKEADFVVVDLGDTVRADWYSNYAFDKQAGLQRMRAIYTGGRFIKQAMEAAGENTTFIIAALSPPGSSKLPLKSSLEQMTPIIVHGPGFGAGSLTSDTTKRTSLVTTLDIAPTVLTVLGLQKTEKMAGAVMRAGSESVTPQSLDDFNKSSVGVKDTRRTAILAYIYIQVILYVLAALVLAYRKILNKLSATVLEVLIFTTMSFPLFSFYTTKIEHLASQGPLVTLLTVVVSAAFATLLVLFRRNKLQPIIGVAALTLIVLTIDVCLGSPSFINSIFGYDTIRGNRFFGIGNEAYPILIANAVLLFGVMLEKEWTKWMVGIIAVISLALTYIIGFPTVGANAGGIIAAVAAFSVIIYHALKSQAKARSIVIAAAAVVITLGGFLAYDVLNGGITHMGKFVLSVMDGGPAAFFIVVNRKLSTNLMILRYSTWSYFLLITICVITFLWFKPVGVLRRLLADHKGISAAITASLIGGIIGFAFEDSGILIPAIMMSYMIPTVIYLMLWEQYHSK
jgi:hypothetical protein